MATTSVLLSFLGLLTTALVSGGHENSSESSQPNPWLTQNVKQEIQEGEAYLHRTAEAGDAAEVKCFLSLGLGVDVRNAMGETPLYVAIMADKPSVVSALLEKGADTNLTFNGVSYVSLAVKWNRTLALASLVENGVDVDVIDSSGVTPLYAACRDANELTECVRLLLAGGANMTFHDPADLGRTPLSWAALRGHVEVVRLILDAGCDIEIGDEKGKTPLQMAAMTGKTEVILLLLDRGANVNRKSDGGPTPLHWAAHGGHTEAAKLLLDRGAEVNAKDDRGKTPLHSTFWRGGHPEVARLLLERGAQVNARGISGLTPLYDAVRMGNNAELAKVLIEGGAEPDVLDREGKTPLYFAARGGNLQIVELLLDKGADANRHYEEGLSVLHYAARTGNNDVTKLLLDKGAEINIKDNHGRTPLDLAIFAERPETAELLRSRGGTARPRRIQ